MKVPDKFPASCRFVSSSGGDDFVKFPDGRVFRLSDDGTTLHPVRDLPNKGDFTSEEYFLKSASASRRITADTSPDPN